MMAAAMAFDVQLIGMNGEMEVRASRIVQNLNLLLTPVPMAMASETELCEQAKADVIALRSGLVSLVAFPMNFLNVFEPYVLNYNCVVGYSNELPEGQ